MENLLAVCIQAAAKQVLKPQLSVRERTHRAKRRKGACRSGVGAANGLLFRDPGPDDVCRPMRADRLSREEHCGKHRLLREKQVGQECRRQFVLFAADDKTFLCIIAQFGDFCKHFFHFRQISRKIGNAAHLMAKMSVQRADIGGSVAVFRKIKLRNRFGGRAVRVFCDMLCGAERTHLRGIQRAAARAVDPEIPGGFSNRIKPRNRGLPVGIHRNATVAMLGADRNPQRLVRRGVPNSAPERRR